MKRSQLVLASLIVLAILGFFALDLQRFLSLEVLKEQYSAIVAYRNGQPWKATGLYALVYIVVTGLSLPGAAVLTLAGGAVFGLLWGTVVVSFASTLGATLAFLASRFLFRDFVKDRFQTQLAVIDRGLARDGTFYLLTLRLVPAFPFFLINLLMGLTAMPTRTFYWVSQMGMLAGTLVYVNAGTQLARIESLAGILSPGLIISFTLLGIFPLLARRALDYMKARKAYERWPRPNRFDRNLVVIGAGSAGLVASYIAAALKAKVTLIEKQRMGGDCLNTGCVPSKTLIRSARVLSLVRRAPEFGIRCGGADIDFAAVMARVRRVIAHIAPHDSAERYAGLGVEVVEGTARIASPWEVVVTTAAGDQYIVTRSIVIAAGARPLVPPLPGLAETGYLTSDTVWNLEQLPPRLLVLGGGPVGCELAQCFARFGSRVTLVEALPKLLTREDQEVSDLVLERFISEHIDVRLNHRAKAVVCENGEKTLVAEHAGAETPIPFDEIVVALGRVANLEGLGLEALGLFPTSAASLPCDDALQTGYPNILVCGDVTGPYQFTHVAAHQAGYASFNALFGEWKKLRVDYSIIPWATFCDPEVARVGLNEQQAREQGIAYEVTRFNLSDLDRAITEGELAGFVKVLTPPGRDRILGVTLVGAHAGDLIAEFVLAMRHGLGLKKLLATIHIYPTFAEAAKQTAGVWRREHAPRGWLRWIERYHQWRLG